MDEFGRLIREHFEEEVRTVRVPQPALPPRDGEAGGARRAPAFVADVVARSAAVVLAAGALVLLAATLGRPAALQETIAAAVRERVIERAMPDRQVLLDMIDASFGRRKTR
jgi:hypothetical protein